jgi:PAS domain S-box-containing protein
MQIKTLERYSNIVPSKENSLYDILILEDSIFVNDAIKEELEKLGHRCDQATRLDEALQLIAEKKYAFIILDLNLPDAYGEELFFSIIRHSEAKIIILTSEQDSEVRATLFKLGVLDYIVKDEKLVKSVHRINETMQNIRQNTAFNILVIDDSSLLRKQVDMILKARSYTIFQAKSGKDAMEILEKESIDMILLDLELPDMHGSTLLEIIKENPSYTAIPILILSGTNDPELISRVLKGGASDFIQKPFNTEQFVLKVDLWSQLRHKSDDVSKLERLLQEHIQALDHDAIVSIVDTQGVFCHVSEKFCELCGYTYDALISQPYSIVCFSDMPAVVFDELCQSAQEPKRWQGKMKLKSKTGQSYLVDTLINPILDTSGNVIEYISIYKEV